MLTQIVRFRAQQDGPEAARVWGGLGAWATEIGECVPDKAGEGGRAPPSVVGKITTPKRKRSTTAKLTTPITLWLTSDHSIVPMTGELPSAGRSSLLFRNAWLFMATILR